MAQRTFGAEFVEQLFGSIEGRLIVLVLGDDFAKTLFDNGFG